MNTMKNKLAFKIKIFYINLKKKENEIVYKFLTCFVIFFFKWQINHANK